ncbi:MAG: hypothetical protein ACTSU2_13850 [Promethearchaeota archaeon]
MEFFNFNLDNTPRDIDFEEEEGLCEICGKPAWLYYLNLTEKEVLKEKSSGTGEDTKANSQVGSEDNYKVFLCTKHFGEKLKEFLEGSLADNIDLFPSKLHLEEIPFTVAEMRYGISGGDEKTTLNLLIEKIKEQIKKIDGELKEYSERMNINSDNMSSDGSNNKESNTYYVDPFISMLEHDKEEKNFLILLSQVLLKKIGNN